MLYLRSLNPRSGDWGSEHTITRKKMEMKIFFISCTPPSLFGAIGFPLWEAKMLFNSTPWRVPPNELPFSAVVGNYLTDSNRRKRKFSLAPNMVENSPQRQAKHCQSMRWLVTLYLNPGSNEWTGSRVRLHNLEAHLQWPTSSTQVPSPKSSTTFQNRATS